MSCSFFVGGEIWKKLLNKFNAKDLQGISDMLSDDFYLEDPVVRHIDGKSDCLNAISNIFNSFSNLNFSAKNIYIDNKTSFIEFILILDEKRLEGVDIIEWNEDNKISALRAYLYEVV